MAELLDPGTPVRSERAHLRGHILQSLRMVAAALRPMVSAWDQGRTVWDGGSKHYTPLGPFGWPSPKRWRRWEEYRENDPGAMRADAEDLRNLATACAALARHLDDEAAVAEALVAERRRLPLDG